MYMSSKKLKSIIDNLDSDDSDVSDTEYDCLVDSNGKDKDEYEEEDIVVGIDLGTTNSLVAIIRNNNYEIITDEYANRTIPSIVSFTNRTKYVGADAKRQLDLNPDNTFYETKRLIGRKFSDKTVQKDIPHLTYKIIGGQKDEILIETSIKSKPYITPEEIASHILQKLKIMAENYLKKPVKKAVITVPAYFNDAQRHATKDAAMIAGLECLRVINEPTAAALMYGLQTKTIKEHSDNIVLVYDLGGGTLDCSILRISDGIFEVLASTGNTHLGGADFDNALVSYCIRHFKAKNSYKKLNNVPTLSLQKLRLACERAKKIISTEKQATIAVKNFYDDKNLIVKMTTDLFQKICKELFILCLKPVQDVLRSAELEKDDIDDIILVGGATRMPVIRNNLKTFFNGKEPNMSVNPDEVVAAGAAIQAHILSHDDDPFSDSFVLLDIVPLSLGVKTIGGEMNVIIPRNSRIPTTRTRRYTTDSDNESVVTIEVFEGERSMTKDNFKIGEFDLTGIEPAPRGIAEIDVTFAIDVNGIINVTAVDRKNVENKKTIVVKCNKGRMTSGEIDKLIKEAEDYEAKDKMERQQKRCYYEIDDLCSNIMSNINNPDYKLKDYDKNNISEDITKIIEWLKSKLYNERNVKEYKKIIDRIKKRYGVLILKVGKDGTVKATDTESNIVSTTVFGGDDEEEDIEKIYEEIEKDEYGFTDDMEEETRRKIKELRDHFVDLCNSIFDVIKTGDLNISKEHCKELKEYINDNLLWVHVKSKITINEYNEKIQEINKTCDDIMSKYSENVFEELDVVQNMNTKKDELEQLCYAIKSSIDNNYFSLDEKNIEALDTKIKKTLDWLIQVDVDNVMGNNKISDDVYTKEIDEINNLCTKLYQTMLNIHVNNNVCILDESDIIVNNSGDAMTSLEPTKSEDIDINSILLDRTSHNSSGTTIASLKKNQKI